MRRKSAHFVSSAPLATPILVNHGMQALGASTGGTNDYRQIPTSLPKGEERQVMPTSSTEESDSDYEHYDFSSKPPVALSTFYNSLRHRAAEGNQLPRSFPMPAVEEGESENYRAPSQLEQRHQEEPAAAPVQNFRRENLSSCSSSEDDYYNSNHQWNPPAFSPDPSLLQTGLPGQTQGEAPPHCQAGPTTADSSSTSSGEWYENFHGVKHQGTHPANQTSFPGLTELSRPPVNYEPGSSNSDGSDYDDVNIPVH
uniref:Uncharacterized protein n=1 Tax=Sphenodon punctatus TaxID=8508 RepID=A0A8D0HX15_SPHPU